MSTSRSVNRKGTNGDTWMWDQGFLSSDQMAGAFGLLNSQDLIWSRIVRNYLLGRRIELTDLMALTSR